MPAPDMGTPAKRRREIKMAPAELVRRPNQNTNDVRTREDSNLINAGSDAPPFFGSIDRSWIIGREGEREREGKEKEKNTQCRYPCCPIYLLHTVHLLRHRDSSDPSSRPPPPPPKTALGPKLGPEERLLRRTWYMLLMGFVGKDC